MQDVEITNGNTLADEVEVNLNMLRALMLNPGSPNPRTRTNPTRKTQSIDKNLNNLMARRRNSIKLRDQSTLEYVT
jgi:hypothetical protein